MMTTEERLHHQAVNLLPSAVAFARSLTPSNFRVRDVRGHDAMNIVQILADVAEALSREKYGKPRFRVPAGRGDPVDDEPQAENRRRSPARPGQGGAEVGPAPGQPRSHGPTERCDRASGGDRARLYSLGGLTEKQKTCCLVLQRWEKAEGAYGRLSGPEVSQLAKKPAFWARPALHALKRAGLVDESRSNLWSLTDAGRALIVDPANGE